jgi:hypothetical protein
MPRALIVACVAILSMAGCSKQPGRPNVDGYTLQGVVLDASSGAPLSEVSVLIGSESAPAPEFHEITATDANGEFTLKPAPPTAPSDEILRLTKPGYVTIDVLARTATRLEAYRYQLEIRLQPMPTP